ncbi:lytic transglycosylase domain-containing protein [Paraburkholderia megapolitana]|uniref:Transglycosylase SLT domain-containing protein n=1 Tax=Paraburkholderia megapolitana TaxID=420953 RepID=A0A1I3L290_9BURK|nr:transglycosylase SLT domain-containing protein [Paraburkholderia megapolitana]QDQ80536.1 lytic transglycosylase domain-containing protein [Paraburkholderia megapolitana]SFI78841.1 Transglycosylase SLT domain-containing protein [Paraburkholderia megapolitana]
MNRLLCALALTLGLIQGGLASESAQGTPPAGQFPAGRSDTQQASDSVTGHSAAQDNSEHLRQRMTDYLTRKFGVARDKAEQIAKAVNASSEKYALPPALLLAIISIESRFKEKAKGTNGATGLMQVVPGAHRDLLRHVKDLTQPDTNIEVGSAILYGYRRSAGGDLNAALKSYGGSKAYAQMVSQRTKAFAGVVGDDDADRAMLPAVFRTASGTAFRSDQGGACDTRWTTFCIGPVVWLGNVSSASGSGLPAAPATVSGLSGGLFPPPLPVSP